MDAEVVVRNTEEMKVCLRLGIFSLLYNVHLLKKMMIVRLRLKKLALAMERALLKSRQL
jgi:hypothetical protein